MRVYARARGRLFYRLCKAYCPAGFAGVHGHVTFLQRASAFIHGAGDITNKQGYGYWVLYQCRIDSARTYSCTAHTSVLLSKNRTRARVPPRDNIVEPAMLRTTCY